MSEPDHSTGLSNDQLVEAFANLGARGIPDLPASAVIHYPDGRTGVGGVAAVRVVHGQIRIDVIPVVDLPPDADTGRPPAGVALPAGLATVRDYG